MCKHNIPSNWFFLDFITFKHWKIYISCIFINVYKSRIGLIINWKVRCISCIYFHPNWYLNSSSQQRRFVSFSSVISLLSLSYYHELLELYTRIASGFPLRCHSEWANYFLYFHHRSCSWKTRHIDSMVFTTGGHAKCLVCKICCKHILLATILLEFICHFYYQQRSLVFVTRR